MSEIVYVGNVDLSTLGFRATAIPGWRDATRRSYGMTQIPGGVNIPAPLATVEPRVLRIAGLLGDDNDTWSERATKLDLLTAAIGRTDRLIHFGDVTARKVTGRLLGAQVAPVAAAMEKMTGAPWVVTLEFWCPDPRYIDSSSSSVTAITTAKAIPAGTARMGGVLVISGGTNPVITAKDSSGNTVGVMTLTAANTGKTITLDFGLKRITTTIDGVTNGLDLWTGWKTESWIMLDPAHWVFGTSSWMTLAVSSGTGVLTYHKAWE